MHSIQRQQKTQKILKNQIIYKIIIKLSKGILFIEIVLKKGRERYSLHFPYTHFYNLLSEIMKVVSTYDFYYWVIRYTCIENYVGTCKDNQIVV